jgi:8-oxo-dGTP pyrophosphatase MutT (NUDIX family)
VSCNRAHENNTEEYDLGAETWQLTLPGGKVADPTPDGILKQAEKELREEIGYRPGRLEKLLNINSHPGYVAHKVLCWLLTIWSGTH